MSMMASADELLKTRSIPDLRQLVQSLARDGENKQQELRLMVGSKYHEFIESADAIAAMRKKTELIESSLAGFAGMSSELVTKANKLLRHTAPAGSASTAKGISKSSTSSPAQIDDFDCPESSKVWIALDECDIFSASKTVLIAILLSGSPVQPLSYLPKDLPSIAQWLKLSDGSNVSSHGHVAIDDLDSLKGKILRNCYSTAFLQQTVLDDSDLVLLSGYGTSIDDGEGSGLISGLSSAVEKAKTLAGLGMLGTISARARNTTKSGVMHQGTLLTRFLEIAETQLEEKTAGLSSASTNIGGQSSILSAQVVTDQLTGAITLLQSTVLDVYFIFFKQVTAELGLACEINEASGVSAPVTGILSHYRRQFIADVNEALKPLSSIFAASDEKASLNLEMDIQAFDGEDLSLCSAVKLRAIFDSWLQRIVQRISQRCKVALGRMQSASEVARLQQRVWHCCCSVSSGKGQNDSEGTRQHCYSNQDWEDACRELLAPKKWKSGSKAALNKSSSRDSGERDSDDAMGNANVSAERGEGAASLLWSSVFRAPFMLQVERLLQQSCLGVLSRARNQLISTLRAEGVLVECVHGSAKSGGGGGGAVDRESQTIGFTAAVAPSYLSALAKHAERLRPEGGSREDPLKEEGGDVAAGDDWTVSGSATSAEFYLVSSPRAFRRAEAIRAMLEDELSEMLGDVISPVCESAGGNTEQKQGQKQGKGDRQSSGALSRAMFVQCSQLAGQLAVLLRGVTAACRKALELESKRGSPRSISPLPHSHHSAATAPLVSAILIIGRLAWLLKIRGRFLEEALIPPSVASGNSLNSVSLGISNNTDICTEDQLRSAFEIADTDGDGVVTNAEAVEAVQALSVGDSFLSDTGNDHLSSALPDENNNSSDISSAIPYLAPMVAPSLNFNEFALLCAHLMSFDACGSLDRCRTCLSEVVANSHAVWSERLSADLSRQFGSAIRQEFLGEKASAAAAKGSSSETGNTAKERESQRERDKDREKVRKRRAQQRGKAQKKGKALRSGSQQQKQHSFASTWTSERLEGIEDDLSTDSREESLSIRLPKAISGPLQLFLFNINKFSSGSMLSIDTVQRLYSASSSTGRLADEAYSLLFQHMVADVIEQYSSLREHVSDPPKPESQFAHGWVLDNSLIEDISTQVIFDLAVFEKILVRCQTFPMEASSHRKFDKALQELRQLTEEWRDKLDPINSQPICLAIDAKASIFFSKISLFLPGVSGPAAVNLGPGLSGAQTGNDTSDATSNIFSESTISRFSLLPLPMTSAALGAGSQGFAIGSVVGSGSVSGSGLGRSSSDTKSVGGGSSASQASLQSTSSSSSSSMAAAKSFIGGLGTSLGVSFLGPSAADTKPTK